MSKDQHWWEWKEDTGPLRGSHACFCIGPQDGQPLCPCAMRAKSADEHKILSDIFRDYDLVPKPRKTPP